MKKLVSLFLWFCAASVMAQACIVGLAASKGNFNMDTLTQIIALVNGIDIQGERLKGALVSAKATPSPTYQDILDAKTNASLQMDSKSRALEAFQRRLVDDQLKLQQDIERFDQRRMEFNLELERRKTGLEAGNLDETRKILSALSPEQTKFQLSKMLSSNQKSDVVALIRGMPLEQQKKLFAEFTQPEDQENLAQVINEVRSGEPMKSLIEGAQKEQAATEAPN